MVANYNPATILPASRTTTGVLGATNQQTFDTANTDWIAFQLGLTGSATVQVQTSSDGGTTWDTIYVITGADGTLAPAATAAGWWFGNSIGALSRLFVSAVAGTVTLRGGTTDVQNAPNGVSGPNSPAGKVTNTPSASLTYTATTTAATLAAAVKTSGGSLAALAISNLTANAAFVKLYAKNGAPVPGTDVPIITIQVAANTTVIQEVGDEGITFANGIAIGVTGLAADADTTANLAGCKILLAYS